MAGPLYRPVRQLPRLLRLPLYRPRPRRSRHVRVRPALLRGPPALPRRRPPLLRRRLLLRHQRHLLLRLPLPRHLRQWLQHQRHRRLRPHVLRLSAGLPREPRAGSQLAASPVPARQICKGSLPRTTPFGWRTACPPCRWQTFATTAAWKIACSGWPKTPALTR